LSQHIARYKIWLHRRLKAYQTKRKGIQSVDLWVLQQGRWKRKNEKDIGPNVGGGRTKRGLREGKKSDGPHRWFGR